MIKNYRQWLQFENRLKKSQKVNIKENFTLMEAMYREAIALKILPLPNSLEGLDIKIKIAKAVNNVPATPSKVSY